MANRQSSGISRRASGSSQRAPPQGPQGSQQAQAATPQASRQAPAQDGRQNRPARQLSQGNQQAQAVTQRGNAQGPPQEGRKDRSARQVPQGNQQAPAQGGRQDGSGRQVPQGSQQAQTGRQQGEAATRQAALQIQQLQIVEQADERVLPQRRPPGNPPGNPPPPKRQRVGNDDDNQHIGASRALTMEDNPYPTSRSPPMSPPVYAHLISRMIPQLPFVQKVKFYGHCEGISCVKYSPDGKFLATASADKRVRIWSVKTSLLLYKLEGHTQGINDLAWSPNTEWNGSSYVVSASDDKKLLIWSTKTWTIWKYLKWHHSNVTCVSFRPDGKRVISGSADEKLVLWRTSTGEVVKDWKAHNDVITAVSFSPNGKLIVSGSFDGQCLIWDGTRERQIQVLIALVPDNTMPVSFAKFLSGGELVLIATLNNTLRTFAADSGNLVKTYTGHVNNKYCICATDILGRYIVSGSEDNCIYIWDTLSENNVPVQKLEGHQDAVLALSVHPFEPLLAAGGNTNDKAISIWETNEIDAASNS